ncbi:FAD:protein FMN transferase [Biformimicrobium ophioploci]|uniref:FAD:protein FMN transferase n=1 Tax=Biformimicrobium ophioploci TaxID=3036711 RepID=A0ABQ6M1E6_9GAMM|nr:FAD:protein FMN transferase [Microbulbifer sp. NKW57]GMG88179.1 FAD:protein FMN transferase [Microbulbifer sp. NKW57]
MLILGLLNIAGCEREPVAWKISGQTMGTTYNVTLVNPPEMAARDEVQSALRRELDEVNRQMSTYIPDSELSVFNDSMVDVPMAVSADLAGVVALSLEIHEKSGGAFDATVGPLVDLWGFGAVETEDRVPLEAEVQSAREATGSEAIVVLEKPARLQKLGQRRLDLSAIAKGHGVDRLAELLLERGFTDFLVEIGGEIRVEGNNPQGLPWAIGVESPGEGRMVQRPIFLSGVALATSGDYRNYFEREGVRYSHTIDPRTGYPITHSLASVTVVAGSAAIADGYATAMNVLGQHAALELAEKENLAVYLLIRDGDSFREIYNPAFEKYLERAEQ